MEIRRRYRCLLLACVATLATAPAAARPILEAGTTAPTHPPQAGADSGFVLHAPETPSALPDDTLSLDAAQVLGRAGPQEAAEAQARSADADARLIADMLDAPRPGPTGPNADPRPRLDETSPHALLHDEEALKQRLREMRDGLSPLFDPKVLEGESEDERELRLRREIALKDSEIRRSVTVGLTNSTPATTTPQRGEPQDGAERAQLRIAQLLLLLWDIATHPISITLVLLYGLVRGVAAILQMAPRRRRTRHRSRKKTARTTPPSAAPDLAMTREMAPPTPRAKRRHRRRRRSFLDRLRSV